MQSRVSIGQVMVKVRSAKQIKASQKNGSKGLGPITCIGKLRSSMNAFKHGGYAHQFVTLGEDPKEFEVFYQAIWDYIQPENILDEDVVEQFIFCAWKQKRSSLTTSRASAVNADMARSVLPGMHTSDTTALEPVSDNDESSVKQQ